MHLRALKAVMKSQRRGALEGRRRTKVRYGATEAVRLDAVSTCYNPIHLAYCSGIVYGRISNWSQLFCRRD